MWLSGLFREFRCLILGHDFKHYAHRWSLVVNDAIPVLRCSHCGRLR